jgi:hypothetical protein
MTSEVDDSRSPFSIQSPAIYFVTTFRRLKRLIEATWITTAVSADSSKYVATW